jgi:hypothetical protein
MADGRSMLDRLFPRQADNRFDGHRAALGLLGLYVVLKFSMSISSIFNTAKVAAGADGIPLDRFDAAATQELLTLFALTGLGQFALAVVSLVVLIRYRTMVPLIYLVLLGEAIARRLIVTGFAAERSPSGSVGLYINLGLLALLAVGLRLSLAKPRQREVTR